MVTKKYYAIKQLKFGNIVDEKLFYIYVILHVNYLCQNQKNSWVSKRLLTKLFLFMIGWNLKIVKTRVLL